MDIPNLNPDSLNDEKVFKHSLTYYENGKLKSEKYLTDDDILVKEIIYSKTGQIREIINYKRDGNESSRVKVDNIVVKSGISISYFESGVIQSQKYFVNGKIHWEEKIFDESGHLVETITYRKGGKEGLNTLFHEKGYKISEINYKDNVPDGSAKFYFDNGLLKAEINFKNGVKTGVSKVYYKNGVLKLEESLNLDIRDGVTKTFYENGGVKEEWNFERGALEGFSKFFYKTGTLFGIKNFREGLEEGLSTFYYSNGKIKEEISYSRGIKSGLNKFYNETGALYKEILYDNGTIIEEREKKHTVEKTQTLSEESKANQARKDRILKNVNYLLLFVSSILIIYILYTLILMNI